MKMVLKPISPGSYDGTVRLSSGKWDQVLKLFYLLLLLGELAKCLLDPGGVCVSAVRHNRCASSSTFASSTLNFFTPSHWLSLPPRPAALRGRGCGAAVGGGGEGEGRLGQEMGSRGDPLS